ncbi:hypothetical protein Btru_040889 [Bulinus truncatus]|nr:hypothetical protein Btru_040889 [Bulinus truncatus]
MRPESEHLYGRRVRHADPRCFYGRESSSWPEVRASTEGRVHHAARGEPLRKGEFIMRPEGEPLQGGEFIMRPEVTSTEGRVHHEAREHRVQVPVTDMSRLPVQRVRSHTRHVKTAESPRVQSHQTCQDCRVKSSVTPDMSSYPESKFSYTRHVKTAESRVSVTPDMSRLPVQRVQLHQTCQDCRL